MFQSEPDSDEDNEVYFLKPVNEYNIAEKIKEANKQLFAELNGKDCPVPGDAKELNDESKDIGSSATKETTKTKIVNETSNNNNNNKNINENQGNTSVNRKVTFALVLENYGPDDLSNEVDNDSENDNDNNNGETANNDEKLMHKKSVKEKNIKQIDYKKEKSQFKRKTIFPKIDEENDDDFLDELESRYLKAAKEMSPGRKNQAKASPKKGEEIEMMKMTKHELKHLNDNDEDEFSEFQSCEKIQTITNININKNSSNNRSQDDEEFIMEEIYEEIQVLDMENDLKQQQQQKNLKNLQAKANKNENKKLKSMSEGSSTSSASSSSASNPLQRRNTIIKQETFDFFDDDEDDEDDDDGNDDDDDDDQDNKSLTNLLPNSDNDDEDEEVFKALNLSYNNDDYDQCDENATISLLNNTYFSDDEEIQESLSLNKNKSKNKNKTKTKTNIKNKHIIDLNNIENNDSNANDHKDNNDNDQDDDDDDDEDDDLSIIVASYLPDDFNYSSLKQKSSNKRSASSSPSSTNHKKNLNMSKINQRKRSNFSKPFSSFRRKNTATNSAVTSQPNWQQRTTRLQTSTFNFYDNNETDLDNADDDEDDEDDRRRPDDKYNIKNLKLNYKTCCEYRNALIDKLPKYTGYLSEYGLSQEQLLERNEKLKKKHSSLLQQSLKAQEHDLRKMEDNERAFTTWLKNKMRFPINKTRNMFDINRNRSNTNNNNNNSSSSNSRDATSILLSSNLNNSSN